MNLNQICKKYLRFSAVAALALVAGLGSVQADDSEVFFPEAIETDTQNPNLLFMIDTSGSMACAQGRTVVNACPDTDPLTRMERLKSALLQVLDDLPPSVNVGLGRFSGGEGGAILFPVRNISLPLRNVVGDQILTDSFTAVGAGSEADEVLSPGNVTDGKVTDATSARPANRTDFGPDSAAEINAVRLGADAETAAVTTTLDTNLAVRVSNVLDEAEQWSNGVVETGDASGATGNLRCAATNSNTTPKGVLNLIYNPLAYNGGSGGARDACAPRTTGTPGRQLLGLRFASVDLPKDVTVSAASLTFTIERRPPTAREVRFRVRAEATDSSLRFSTANNNVSSRTRTSASLTATISSGTNPDTGGTLTVNGLQTLITEVRDRAGWARGNPITLILEDNSSSNTDAQRIFHSFLTGGSGNAPRLNLTYSTSTTTAAQPNKLLTALRFDNVQIPKGASVRGAFLELRARGAQSTNLSPQIRVRVSAEAADEPAPLVETNFNLFSRSRTTQSVDWALPTSVSDQDSVISPDLKDVIQAITDRTGWCGGGSITLLLDGSLNAGTGSAKQFVAYSSLDDVLIDTASGETVKDGPILHLELDAADPKVSGAGAGCARGRSVSAIAVNNDDAEQNLGNNSVSLGDGDLELGFDSNKQVVAVRFSDVRVPTNAVIRSARLDFTALGASSGSASLLIAAESVGNATPFTTATNSLAGRAANKTAQVVWSTAEGNLSDWADGSVHRSPDLTSMVQSVVSGAGWTAGNQMAFFIETDCATTCRRRAYSRNGKTSAAPRLVIEYQGSALALTVRDELKRLVLDLPTSGGTPSVPALYEVARYFRGEAAFYGRTRGSGETLTTAVRRQHRISHVKTFTAASGQTLPTREATCRGFNPGATDCATERWLNTTVYDTPILNACSSNNVVLFTDGAPTINNAEARVKAMIGLSSSTACMPNAQSSVGGNCARDLAKFLNTQDQSRSGVGANLNGVQTVKTYTIGMDLPATSQETVWLQQVAADGGGANYNASSAESIVSAFQSIVAGILDINTTFVAPAVTVNTFNRLTNRDELYFALFNPAPQVKWEGNVKKYKLLSFGGTVKIADANNAEAVDTATGFFRSTSRSIWSAATDGANVQEGGAVSRLTATRRTLTYDGANKPAGGVVSPTDLSTILLDRSNTNLTRELLGMPPLDPLPNPDNERLNLLDWTHGIDVDDINSNNDQTDARRSLGDPLHSQPLLVSYKGTNDADATNDDITLFFGTNEGGLHAIDSATGNEIFSFTPKELLRNLHAYRNNVGDYRNRPYGLDGPITRLFNDVNRDLELLNSDGTPQTGEFLYLYAGMRRGGRNYYSMDVTDRAAPKLRWVIYGGQGDYAELGQTWSDAVVRKIKFQGAVRNVIIFTGGYDPDADTSIRLKDDADQGRAVYIADALTGERLWWASLSGANLNLPQMKFSIPASPRVLDLDVDGISDRIYVADAGGQIFRFVLKNDHAASETAATLVTGSRIAMLSDADTAEASRTEANARRFFASPDVSFINQGGNKQFLAISIGSGFREKPNNTTIQDRFYVLRDPDEKAGPVSPLSIIESGTIPNPNPNGVATLFNATSNAIGETTGAEQTALRTTLDNGAGFFIILSRPSGGTETFIGEKVFTESLTVGGNVLFASFTPNVTTSACQAVAGLSKLYLISVLDGTPVVDYSTPNPPSCSGTSCNRADRSINLNQQGLPSDPVLIFPSLTTEALVCVGSECGDAPTSQSLTKAYWLKRE